MITKEGKARWVYRCTLCSVERYAPDQLRILEAQNRHIRGNVAHVMNGIAEAFTPIFNAYATMARTIIEQVKPAMEQHNYALMPPPNVPHDPALLKDRRKWGGR